MRSRILNIEVSLLLLVLASPSLPACYLRTGPFLEPDAAPRYYRFDAPEWTRDLVIYELNPYAFTSPHGAGDGSGSGNWNSLREKLPYLHDLGITGIWCAGFFDASDHFYGIKSNYACMRPDRMDPALGTADEFKAFVAEAHRRGIRVFLDVVTHGVLKESPLIREHPEWFKRTGTWGMIDYDYDDPGFREWWVELWTRYVLDYGVDGYRLDVSVYDKVLWDRIADNCRRAGRPIAVFCESFGFGRVHVSAKVAYHFPQAGLYGRYGEFSADVAGEFKRSPPYFTMMISCHDEGWTSPPGNYYVLGGSRFRFGYSTVFSPYLPVFFSGEEFDAEQVSLPGLKKGLFGGGGPGGWLYGSWIQWEQLDQPRHRGMLEDCKRMLRIRRENRDLIHSDREDTHIIAVPFESSAGSPPVPYARFIPGEKAIIVAGNNSIRQEATFSLEVPLEEMGMQGRDRYRVVDLWSDTEEDVRESRLSGYKITVPRDRTAGGGVRAIMIEAAR